MKQYLAKYYALLPVLLLCIFYTIKAVSFPMHDFANYYFGGKFLAESHFASWVYFPYPFNKAIADLGYTNIFVSYAPNTPFLALLFLPVSFLPLAAAKLIFNSISVLLFVFTLKRLADFYKISLLHLLLVPVLFFVPIKNELLFGQVYFLLFFLLGESWLAYEKKRYWKMAILLSFALFLKVLPILLVAVFVFKKQWRPLVYVVAASSSLFLLSILFNGLDIWIFYLENVLPKASNGEISGAFVANYQSLFMFLKQLLVFDSVQNPNAVFDLPVLFYALVLVIKIKLIAIGFYVTRRANNSLYIFSYWLLAMLVISPYGSTYAFILLIFPFFALLKSPVSDVQKIIGCGLFFVISNIPLSAFLSNEFPFSYIRLMALLLLFALFLSWMYQYIEFKVLALAVTVPLVLVLFFKKNESSPTENLLPKNAPILIYDYKIENNRLTYFYWNENGENVASVPFENLPIEKAEIKNNQIFVAGKQLTFDGSNKQKALRVGNQIMYLSDSGRGIGFYTLRKIKIN
ncbi:MAG TPA: glycosyltransferase family 87 protein [Flavobacterium sp.]|nr:glycosyltransferase family 87 protein [Flavobacterium sp.]